MLQLAHIQLGRAGLCLSEPVSPVITKTSLTFLGCAAAALSYLRAGLVLVLLAIGVNLIISTSQL